MPKPVSLQLVSCLKEPQGRYDGNHLDTYTGLNRATPPLNVRTAIGKVQDPSERDPTVPQQRIAVTINRNVDVLENERSHDRISEAAYRVGREIQRAFERQNQLRTTFRAEPGGSRDVAYAHEMAIGYAIEEARAVEEIVARVSGAVGPVGARVLRAVIGEGKTFKQMAEARGRSGDRGINSAADQFRWLLEDLAEAWAARGKG